MVFLQKAPIVKEWAGLRPYRMNPRVEHQVIEADGRKLSVFNSGYLNEK